MPKLEMKITQALVTSLITLWFLSESEAKGQEYHHHFLARVLQTMAHNCHSTLFGQSLYSCCENMLPFSARNICSGIFKVDLKMRKDFFIGIFYVLVPLN